MIDLDQLNRGIAWPSSLRLLDGVYEHSPWIAERRAGAPPVREPRAARSARWSTVRDSRAATRSSRLIRAHPELAGKAMVDARR